MNWLNNRERESKMKQYLTAGVALLLSCCVQSADTSAASGAAGADVPFITCFAADAEYTGTLLQSVKRGDIAAEAVTRRAVRLEREGDRISFKAEKPFNSIVVRCCIPDAPQGGGIDATLSVLADGRPAAKLPLHSRYTWLYADSDGGLLEDPAVAQKPGGFARNFFDEARLLLDREFPAGTVLTLRKSAGDDAPFYVIDLVDFELVPPPLPCPPDALPVTEFGATADDGADDTAALRKCVAEAKKQGKKVYIPRGVFRQDGILELDNVTVCGAGMWHSTLMTHVLPSDKGPWNGNLGFRLAGRNIRVSDLHVIGFSRRRGKPFQRGVVGSGENFELWNLWIERCGVGIWIGNCRDGVIRNCRFRNNKADGINVNNNSHRVLIENCHARGNGDDSFAAFSNTDKGGGLVGSNSDILFRRNTSESNWWGNGIGLYGGVNIAAENNLVRGAQPVVGIQVSTGHSAWPFDGVTVRGNRIVDCGGVNWNQKFGSIWVHSPGTPIAGAVIENNTIRNGLNDAVKLQGGKSEIELVCRNNRIQSTTGDGVRILGNVRGKVTLDGNTFGAVGGRRFRNDAGKAVGLLEK